MAGKYGPASVTLTYDDAPGGTPRAVTSFVLEVGGVKITQNTEQSDTFGDAWEKHTPIGKGKVDPVTMKGFWDTTATTGPHAVFLTPDSDPNGATRTLTIVFGDGKTFTVETRLQSYNVMANNKELTKFEAEVLPTGQPTWS